MNGQVFFVLCKVCYWTATFIHSNQLNILDRYGCCCWMDGINDAPALTQADVGIAMGSGTDVAQASGHVILLKSDLQDVVYAFKLGEYSLKKIKQNLAISFAYNSITIPIAAGLLYNLTNSFVLTPTLAALGWIVSDSAVFGNSLLVRRFVMRK